MPGFELFGAAERNEVAEVLQTGILTRYGFDAARNNIWKARDLEAALCAETGADYAQLTSSGTAALITALMALGIGAGHEVIIPVFAHVGVFEAIVLTGAVPVPVDIDESLSLDPQRVIDSLTPKTKAVLVVHPLGGMADIERLKQLCEEKNLLLIEDLSQSVGARHGNQSAGTFGIAGFASFDYTNTITCGEGGVVLTSDPSVYKRCDEYTDHGHDHLGATRKEDSHRYLGSNFRISELHAAIGLAQLRRLPHILERQAAHAAIMTAALLKVKGISLAPVHNSTGSWVTILLESELAARSAVEKLLQEELPHAYWYDDRWHYVRKWEHLKNGSWMNRLYDDQKKEILHYSNLAWPQSDAVMSRVISFAISLSPGAGEMATRAAKLAAVLNEI